MVEIYFRKEIHTDKWIREISRGEPFIDYMLVREVFA